MKTTEDKIEEILEISPQYEHPSNWDMIQIKKAIRTLAVEIDRLRNVK